MMGILGLMVVHEQLGGEIPIHCWTDVVNMYDDHIGLIYTERKFLLSGIHTHISYTHTYI